MREYAWRIAYSGWLGVLTLMVAGAPAATADPLGLGVPARVFLQEKTLGGPFYTRSHPDVEGLLVEYNGSVLVIMEKGSQERKEVPLDSVAHLDVSRSRRGRPVMGAIAGFGVGFFVGVAVPVDRGTEPFAGLRDGFDRAENAIFGAFLGTLAGVIVGSAVKSEDWEEVPAEQLRIAWVPRIGTAGHTASLELCIAFR
jgi:hypothetical protein